MTFRSTNEIVNSLNEVKQTHPELATLMEETINRLTRQEERHRLLSKLTWETLAPNRGTMQMISTTRLPVSNR